jgi:hypothetical protein
MKNRSISDSFNMKFIKEVYLYMNGGGCYTVHYDSRIPS